MEMWINGEKDVRGGALLLQPRRSFALFVLFGAIHFFAFFVVMMLSLHWFFRLLFALCVLGHFFYILDQHILLRGSRRIMRCWRGRSGVWYLQFRNGLVVSGDLLERCFISRYLMLLNFKVGGRRFPVTLTLAFDSDSKDVLRKLRLPFLLRSN